jgi:hypothetical protein
MDALNGRHMEPRIFFAHYLPALAQALRHNDEREDFFVKGPDYYYGAAAKGSCMQKVSFRGAVYERWKR